MLREGSTAPPDLATPHPGYVFSAISTNVRIRCGVWLVVSLAGYFLIQIKWVDRKKRGSSFA